MVDRGPGLPWVPTARMLSFHNTHTHTQSLVQPSLGGAPKASNDTIAHAHNTHKRTANFSEPRASSDAVSAHSANDRRTQTVTIISTMTREPDILALESE